MTRPSIRRTILHRSVERHLEPGEKLHHAVLLTTRHRWFVPYALGCGVVIFLVASATGVETLPTRLVLAACGLAVAAIATTEHTVLAETDRSLALLRSSRIRQYATSLVRRLPDDTEVEMVGSTVITSDWRIDGVVYTLTKRWETTMRQIAMDAGL